MSGKEDPQPSRVRVRVCVGESANIHNRKFTIFMLSVTLGTATSRRFSSSQIELGSHSLNASDFNRIKREVFVKAGVGRVDRQGRRPRWKLEMEQPPLVSCGDRGKNVGAWRQGSSGTQAPEERRLGSGGGGAPRLGHGGGQTWRWNRLPGGMEDVAAVMLVGQDEDKEERLSLPSPAPHVQKQGSRGQRAEGCV